VTLRAAKWFETNGFGYLTIPSLDGNVFQVGGNDPPDTEPGDMLIGFIAITVIAIVLMAIVGYAVVA
jgi:hypothetical protein